MKKQKEKLEEELYLEDDDAVSQYLYEHCEDLPKNPYYDAAPLDPNLPFDSEDYINEEELEEMLKNIQVEEDYKSYDLDIKCGDIVLASVYQEGSGKNLTHISRPFLVIYANSMRVYGFQITSTFHEARLINSDTGFVEIVNYKNCGLIKPCWVSLGMIRGVNYDRLLKYIGHITPELKKAILTKLYAIKEHPEDFVDYCAYAYDEQRLSYTIDNVERLQ